MLHEEQESNHKPATLETIARFCGVSKGAVSQILKNPHNTRFSLATRERILEAVKKLNYRPNRMAQALRSGSNQLISLVVPWNTPELLDGVEITAKQRQYNTMIQFTFDRDLKAEKDALFSAIERRVDGIIWMPGFPSKGYRSVLQQLAQNHIDVVFIDWGLNKVPIPYGIVEADYLTPFKAFFDKVPERGYTEVIIFTRERIYETWGERLTLMKSYFENYPLPVRYVKAEDFPQYFQNGKVSSEWLFELENLSERPMVFRYDDWGAVRLLFDAKKRGVRVPDQLGILAMGDILLGNQFRVGELTSPMLSAIRRPSGLMAQTAVELLINRIEGRSDRRQTDRIILPASLIERESSLGIQYEQNE